MSSQLNSRLLHILRKKNTLSSNIIFSLENKEMEKIKLQKKVRLLQQKNPVPLIKISSL